MSRPHGAHPPVRDRAAAVLLLALLMAQPLLALPAPVASAAQQPAREVHVSTFDDGSILVEGAASRTERATAELGLPPSSKVLSATMEVSRVHYRVHRITLDAPPEGIWCGDLDNDGASDDVLVTMPSLGRADLLSIKGDPPGATLLRSFRVPGACAVAVSDLDIDRILDVVIASETEGRLYVFGGLGAGQFDDGRTVEVGPRPVAIESANLDVDFHPDLVVADSGGSSLTVLHGRGDLSFYPQRVWVGRGPTSVRLVDVDRDLDMDIVVAESRNGTVTFLSNIGNGNVTVAQVLPAPGGPVDVDVRDLDGDSMVDIAAACAESDGVLVWRQLANGSFERWESLPSGLAPRALIGVHANRAEDLRRDIAVASSGSDNLTVLLADGMMNHSIALDARVGGLPVDLLAANLLHDKGQEDILVACQDPPALAIVEVLPVANVLHFGIGVNGTSGKVDLPEDVERATVNFTLALAQWVSAHRAEARGGKLLVPVAAWCDVAGTLALARPDVWCAPDRPPRAWAPPDVKAQVGETVELSGSASYDPEGELTRLVWRLPDGRQVEGVMLSVSYATAGTYTILLQAFDPWGLQDMDAVTVYVNAPPTAQASVPATARAREPVRLDAYLSSDTDGSIVDYIWDYGQGVVHGSAVYVNFTGSGKRTVTLEVIDDDGARATATYSVNVTAAARPVRPPGEKVPADRGAVPGPGGAGALLAMAAVAATAMRRTGRRRRPGALRTSSNHG